jgi:hypothetical protein
MRAPSTTPRTAFHGTASLHVGVRPFARVGIFVMRSTILLALIPAVVACSGSDGGEPPAQVAGNYALTLTDGQNGCNVQNFTTNATQTGTVAITQDGSSITATAMQTSGLVLAFAAGDTIAGTIVGSEASLSASASLAQGACTYATTATVNIRFSDTGAMQGTIFYTEQGNGSSDCTMQQCTSTQTFTGSR